MVLKLAVALAIGLASGSCTVSPAPAVPRGERWQGTDGAMHEISPLANQAYAVLIFFAADCHVLQAHDERIQKVAAEYGPRGVRFLAIDSEVDATLDRDRAEALRRGYAFPVLLDRGARLARAMGAEYAGYCVILDRWGDVLYRGGIDSDRVHLRDDATPYLSDALTDLLAAKRPRRVDSKALGCALRIR